MNYTDILNNDEKVLHVSKIHIFVLYYSLIFSVILGALSVFGSFLFPRYQLACYINTAIFAAYPIAVLLLIANTRWVITNQRVIEQLGFVNKRHRSIPLNEITNVSFRQTKLGKIIKYGNVRIKMLPREGRPLYVIFKHISRPHEFIVTIPLTCYSELEPVALVPEFT